MEIKKFLDEQGLSYLWKKLSLQDYPNNDTLVAVINAIDENKADKTTTEALQQAIDILNGTGDGSVKYTVADAVATIVAHAPEDFDTLKEIADWIANDETGTINLVNKVEENKKNIKVVSDALAEKQPIGDYALKSELEILPTVTAEDAGKFLRVSDEGIWIAEAIPQAEEASF